MPTYNPKAIEPKWQRFWEDRGTFRAADDSDKPKFYILDMFPYPSGAGLHVGHPEGYTATDILARYRRMRGDHVLHPMGWDAFGLPAEKYAVKTGQHPRQTTLENIATFRRQIKTLGFSYDWDREVDTTAPDYFKWTQWIFLQLFDTWYDSGQRRGRPIVELPIPPGVRAQGPNAVRAYQDARRLAYQVEAPVNWCPELGTVLANEEVEDGKSKEEGYPVLRTPLRQWLLRITAYADRLLEELERVDWPESIKKLQSDWIGRSEGADVEFVIETLDGNHRIHVFTTRPDTLFGATYMVLAPEHPLVDAVTTAPEKQAVDEYKADAARKSDLERTELAKRKSGVFTGAYAVNPVNGERIPVWIADYVLISYGTGAIMAVPAHDERDFEFARQYGLPIRPVVRPPRDWLRASNAYQSVKSMRPANDDTDTIGPGGTRSSHGDDVPPTLHEETPVGRAAYSVWRECRGDVDQIVDTLYLEEPELFEVAFTGEGTAINSGEFNELPTADFKKRITAWLHERGLGTFKVNYKLRDWLFSRQRYWGEPFPILHEVDAAGKLTGFVVPLTVEELPLELPELEDYKPSGRPEPPLEKATDWMWVTRDGRRYKRETNTMPQWAGSCWYYLRYLDPHNGRCFCDPAKERAWMPVDLYVGGAEHAVLHLLYARFWHKVLYDRGHVHTSEPFRRLVNQGMILGEMEFTVSMDRRLTEDEVEKRGDRFVWKEHPELPVLARAHKMSKSRGNVINPDQVVNEYGADSLRLYEMFMGPLEATKPWSMRGVEGVYRFLSRVWRLYIDDRAEQMKLSDAVQDVPPDKDTLRMLHQTIQKVTEDLDALRFNTAIAAMMELTNHLTKLESRPRAVLEPLVLLLAPFAPHLAEELWSTLGHPDTLAYEPWPSYDVGLTQAEENEVPVQINGKLRSKVHVAAGADEATLKAAALADEKIKGLIQGKQIRKVIVVPGKLVNIVVS